ncbi:hypothetical protein A3C86_01220 [Candidatus Kaiserbacteria bacterium RIFCSPHIGHO2_02_FULL_49_16]|uniref:Uncharacterized protein n=1 Tax=Candidatus Kaiserbacteria bacterium RIFCSPHIGHO2_02_FULL_49_16 TaxID=1798490 RepID=A0A1F6DC26_9BACT|nr:MAG: hypothetical protein A3C86_01220 [Candidatus Kaiserbacteria bacterium RIFCSPHIGHO2_02_FULL_49_16]
MSSCVDAVYTTPTLLFDSFVVSAPRADRRRTQTLRRLSQKKCTAFFPRSSAFVPRHSAVSAKH